MSKLNKNNTKLSTFVTNAPDFEGNIVVHGPYCSDPQRQMKNYPPAISPYITITGAKSKEEAWEMITEGEEDFVTFYPCTGLVSKKQTISSVDVYGETVPEVY